MVPLSKGDCGLRVLCKWGHPACTQHVLDKSQEFLLGWGRTVTKTHTALSSWPGVDKAGKRIMCDLCRRSLDQRKPQVTERIRTGSRFCRERMAGQGPYDWP